MTSNSWSSNLSVPCALGISSCASRYALTASSSGAGRSLLKARNTADMKNSLGSIFIRIAHLLRCLDNSPRSGHVNDQSSHQPDLTYGVVTLPLLILQTVYS